VLAHPDDESFGMGGTIAYYATQGVDIHLICATRGEAGTVDPQFTSRYKSISKLREAELSCAAKVLGLKSVTFLGYRDSGMAGSPENKHSRSLFRASVGKVSEKIARYIKKLRPQIVVTFDPVGGYHHPDHIAVHKATVEAFHAALKAKTIGENSKLYYIARSRRRLRFIVRVMRLMGKDPTRVGRNQDIDLTVLARDPDTPPHVSINYRRVEDRKRAADECHASQQEGRFSRLSLLELYWRLMGRRDTFTRAYPPTGDFYRAIDLFAD
jgi:N-acetyl-1-D-myo-inositol-2-amino-2-deoxy-alpha-D-glucopyranoside deacetylase